ncbi:hypothetical protein MOO45_03680 [Bombilactobacillus folatiphilus]|uniref:Uncharacterized protein n=1 Tax=Bombilactobacillus folatiphilus TaxID=2923362 RepID=A0ABY4PAT3_9LACO|nr:SPJ_0845 family protein [Bombilactobacillus folatiphilus]UQS82754.1 hypothetical protein MOO45_03680 [Bombilactobacillus folatiphilus]
MGLTVKRENNFESLFDKFASLPDETQKDLQAVKETKDKLQREKDKN